MFNVSAIHTLNSICDFGRGAHSSRDCQIGNTFSDVQIEQINFVNNFQRPKNLYPTRTTLHGRVIQIYLGPTTINNNNTNK